MKKEGAVSMGILAKRPLLTACAVFLAASLCGICLDAHLRLIGMLVLGIGILPAIAGMLCFAKLRRGLFAFLLCLLFGIGAFFLSHSFFDGTLAPLEAQTEPVRLTASIVKVNYTADYLTSCNADVTCFNDVKNHFSVDLNFEGEADLEVGDVIEATAVCVPFGTTDYGYDLRSSKLSKGVLLSCDVESYDVIGKEALPFFARLRCSIAERFDRAYEPETAAMLKALLIGDKDHLDAGLKRDFRRLGISHILAISGTHFSVLLGMAALLLRLLRLNKKQIYILLLPLALLYMGISGFSPSVCRAGIMAMLSYLAFLLGRTRDACTALFVAVCALIACHPYAVLDVGLWLSFAATFSILILSELFSKVKVRAGRGERLCTALLGLLSNAAVTVAVSFCSLPITAFCFGETSLIAPLANLLIVPLFELFLYLAPFALLFSGFSPAVHLTETVCAWICRAATALADRDDLLFSLRQPLVLPIAVCGVALTLLLLILRLKHPMLVLLPAVLTIGILAVYIPMFNASFAAVDRAVFMTAGKNEGFVLASGGETLYIDISTGASAPTRRAEWIAETLYDPELDGYLPTHYHMRHISTFNKLIARTHIKRLYLPPAFRESDYNVRAALAAAAERDGIEVVALDYAAAFDFADCTITLTEPQLLKRSTHPVICLSIKANEDEVLYLGSSFADTTLDITSMTRDAGLIVLGRHAPITKRDFSIRAEGILLFAGADTAEFADFDSEALCMHADSSFTYCFGK